MDIFLQVMVTGLTLGALYALAATGLALVWGTLGMFNMAHGIFMTVGAYGAFVAVDMFGFPRPFAFVFGLAAGGIIGAATYLFVARFMIGRRNFETNIIVATAGIAILAQDIILKIFGAYPFSQPVVIDGKFSIGDVIVPTQRVLILVGAALLLLGVNILLTRTKLGRAIRATAMSIDAARLMGVRTSRTYLQVIVIAGVLAGAAGIMVSSLSTLSPQMGGNPMLMAFVVCVVAGLGHIGGTGLAAIGLGILEATIQYFLGVQYGFPVMLLLVILFLIWRPNGLFGKQLVVRL
ncbi:branched-chain amino acid ABC transporter permease [uncultured Roseovarius sp.]|uniref:branched-chain amino acid ABC transporter permease n=1 Tax=uncultured Roseovarius sp. TaxID=293344 RepID=UPI002625B01F|nr:branched-chain amino acid ABC transporter permease [uncultured Roseovarius sp.]